MHFVSIVALFIFIAAWFGAAASWAVAAHSAMHVWTDGSLALIDRYRVRAFKAGAVSATFVATGVIAGMVSGLFNHLHV